MKKIKANPTQDYPKAQQEELGILPKSERIKLKGIGCSELPESVPSFNKAQCEDVIEGRNNTWIVLGRDRNGPLFVTGSFDNGENHGPYGPKGHTRCGSIDIIAGRFSANTTIDKKVEPDFFKDAARIYISQRTDVDANFKIGDPKNDRSKGRSAIALKADGVRLIAREGIKLVTGTDRKNSLGGNVHRVDGIELIAGNDETDLQSILKGENTKEALERLVHHVDKLNGLLDAFLTYQMKFNEAMTLHTHISPFYALSTTPSEVLMVEGRLTNLNLQSNVKLGLYKHKINLVNHKNTYLKEQGKKFVCSRYNKVN